MFFYFLRRLPGAFGTLFLLAALTFFLMRLAPGGPFDSDQIWPPEIQANILKKYELDRPLFIQFAHWIGDVSHGDLRESFQYLGKSVNEIIFETLPISLYVGGGALLFAILIGIPLGCIAAWNLNSLLDRLAMFFSISGISLPSYLVASVLILVFALRLGWFPPALWESSDSWVLPVLTLGWRPMGILARLTRASILEALRSDYIRTAMGKGLSKNQVLFKHALRNSLIPVVTAIGPMAANLLTGSFLVESVFQIPGMGKYFVQAVLNRDYPLVMGVTLVYGTILILTNLMIDACYALIDPRIRIEKS